MTEPRRIVFVHGSMDTSASFRPTTALLDDFEVVTYDRRGYGSAAGHGAPDLPGHVDDLLKVLDGTPSVVVGHSLGGSIALSAAVREPALVRAAFVYEPPMPWLPWWPGLSLPARRDAPVAEVRAAAEGFLREHIGDKWDEFPVERREIFLRSSPAWVAELWSAVHDAPPFEPEEVAVPVVVGHGSDTGERHVRAAEELAARVPGALLRTVDASEHTAHRRHPAEFAGLVRLAVERSEHGR